MKYLFSLFILAALLTAGCNAESAPSAGAGGDGKIVIVSTIFPPFDFARNIAGDKAEISLLLPLSSDSHSYEPSPRDIIKIREADVFLYVGGASDEWTESVFSGGDNVIAVRLMDSVSLLEDDHAHGSGYFSEYDEHVWTSPRNAVLMALAISEALCAADPENAEFYRNNAVDYIARLEALDDTFREIINSASRKTVVIADRFAFRYLTEEYGLEYFAAFPGCAEQTEPSAQTLAFLIEKIREEEIPAVFYGELSDMRTANSISRETGAQPLLLHSCHTLSREMFDAGLGYIELMEANAEELKKALN